MCMLKFLLIFCFIGVVAYLVRFFLLPCLEVIKNGEESELYKKISDEIVDYCKEKDINMNTDDDFFISTNLCYCKSNYFYNNSNYNNNVCITLFSNITEKIFSVFY